ncbi:MAG: DNA (cytosine-5-)-methyltransferase [Clostridiales bacterium]|nr:DNA (cytosine-5-)-methyltransferase [Clostridiales bacterium]
MKYLSTFTGIGGFELGINKAYDNLYKETSGERDKGLQQLQPSSNGESRTLRRSEPPTCIGYSEINKYAIQIYQSKFPEHKNYGDITKINEKELPDFDLFVGGFPCQAFSIAGKRGGFDDTRGTLFFDCARILKEKQPRNFILENVKGLLSHDNGRTFKTIINTLTELGYCVEWQVLNAKNFGVPQNRERVFIVGHLGGIPERKVFPIGQNDKEDIKSRQVCTSATGSTRTGSTAGGQQFISQLNNPSHSNDRVYGTDGLSPTLNTMQGGNRQPFIRNPYNGKQSEIESGTLGTSCGTTTGKTAQLLHKDTRIRRLTPLECERLMGYPDNWTDGLSDTQRYKTLGNGIVSNVVAEVVKRLYSNPSQITEDNKDTNPKE